MSDTAFSNLQFFTLSILSFLFLTEKQIETYKVYYEGAYE